MSRHAHKTRLRLAISLTGILVLAMSVAVSPAWADFGLSSPDVTFTTADGTPQVQAGTHPFDFTTTIDLNTKPAASGEVLPEEEAKDVAISLPAGLVGTPDPVPPCSDEDFVLINAENPASACPNSSAVGVATIVAGFGAIPSFEHQLEVTTPVPVFNLEAPPGVASKLGFVVAGAPVTVETFVNAEAPYNLVTRVKNIPNFVQFYGAKVTLWGVPADPAHDAERGRCALGSRGCPSSLPETPFLTLPRACVGPLTTTFQAESWQHPGVWTSPVTVETHDNSSPPSPLGFQDCSSLGFAPLITANPTTRDASSPTGLDFTLNVKDEGLTAPDGTAESDIKKAVVTLPEGVTANPALAEGLAGCSAAELAKEAVGLSPGEGCPEESKIGTVEVETPLLSETLKGSLYLASPYANPFGSLIALYVVIENPETGILIKLPGDVVPNEVTGQLSTVFDNLPQLPFSHFRLHFREGQRSPLVTPPLCGTYTTDARLTPWANPEAVLHDSATFQVTSGVAGYACPAGGMPPFKPNLVGGTLNNGAGAYSAFDLRITRNDGEQEITGFSSTLPPGLTAKLTGVPFCSEADIGLAKTKSGAAEEASPSCPVASEIGHTLVGVGVGAILAYNPGKLYMAGPYQGAPFSIVAITAAKVGPFDLGTVVVHLPLDINSLTAQVSIPQGPADQIPHIIKGIVVHVRDIRVYVDRPEFIRNPTSCEPMALTATVFGAGASFASAADDQASTVTDHFQAADCGSLPFAPKLTAATKAHHSRKQGAYFHVDVKSSSEAANIKEVHVELPKKLPSELKTLQKACPQSQFEADPTGCPAGSVVGHAKASTPILPVPLEGPAYFVSYGSAKYPELVIALHGYGITIDLHGETSIKDGVTSSTFKTVPDQPVESFELTLPMSDHPALAMTTNFCKHPQVMPTRIVSQSGKVIEHKIPIATEGCKPAIYILKHRVDGAKANIIVRVPSAGKLTLNGNGIHRNTKKIKSKSGGLYTITVPLTQHLRSQIHQHRHGHAVVNAHLTFKPTHGKTLHTKLNLRFG